jgi:hypothetical protein
MLSSQIERFFITFLKTYAMKQKEDIIAKLLALSKQRIEIRKEIFLINRRLDHLYAEERMTWEQLETTTKTEILHGTTI